MVILFPTAGVADESSTTSPVCKAPSLGFSDGKIALLEATFATPVIVVQAQLTSTSIRSTYSQEQGPGLESITTERIYV